MKILSVLSKQQVGRVFGLDILRATAIVLVLYSHGFDPLLSEYFPSLRSLIFMDGVDLFFVLSGFLIGTILVKQFENKSYFTFGIIFKFWKRRWMRTLPNYYFIIFTILFIPVIVPWIKGDNIILPVKMWIKFLIFSQNIFTPQVSFFSEAWSLAVEEWFYLIIPIMLWVLHSVFAKILSKKNIFLLLIFLIIVLDLIIRYKMGLSLGREIEEWNSNLRMIVITRLDSLIYGVLGAFIKFYYPQRWMKQKYFLYQSIFGIICLAGTHYAYLQAIEHGVNVFMNTGYFSITAIGVLCFIPQMDTIIEPPKNKILNYIGMAITHISLISYSLYLTHGYLILGHLVRYKNQYAHIYMDDGVLTGILFFIFYILLSIVVSTILYYTIEKTFMNLRSPED